MFKIKTKNGTYMVQMRGQHVKSITSEKKLIAAIKYNIAEYRKMKHPSWVIVADRFQELLDERDFHRIASEWGMFNDSEKVQ